MKKCLIACALFISMHSPAAAEELFTPAQKQEMMKLTLESFWGKAVGSDGKPIEPKDDEDRRAMPISEEQGLYIIDKGAESGMAEWCDLEWMERYELMMRQQQSNLGSDKPLAYVGMLHGMAMAMMLKSLEKEKCDADTKDQMEQLLEGDVKSLKKSLANKQ